MSSANQNDRFFEAIEAYTDKFNEGPPVWGYEPDEAIRLIEEAIKTGVEMEGRDSDEEVEL